MKIDEKTVDKIFDMGNRVCMTVLFWLFVIAVVAYVFGTRYSVSSLEEQEQQVKTLRVDTLTYVRDLIYKEGIAQPKVVYAQFLLETGYGSSRILKQNNNCFGMKRARTRPTLAVGTHSGHAVFNSIEDSVKDYALWQNLVKDETRMNEARYLAMLKKTYAEDRRYVDKLKSIIKDLS